MCVAGEALYALKPTDTQFPQQQLETQTESQPERIAYIITGAAKQELQDT